MTGGISGVLDEIVRDIHKFYQRYIQKSEDEFVFINSSMVISQEKRDYLKSGAVLSNYNLYFNQFLKSKGYDYFDQKGYIFVPPNVRIERLPQKDIGYGILGTANLSSGVIQILETLYGKDFEEVLLHESLHLQNWDKSESWVRYETKQKFGEKARFH